jgi:D-alanyl-D-alanine carboxypeptidase
MRTNFLIILTTMTMLISCGKIPTYDCMGRSDFQTNQFITLNKAKSIADILCNYVNNEKVPCIQVTVIDSIGNNWTLTTGTSDVKRRRPASNDDLLRLASITKTFTSTVILSLVEQGKLNLDDKLITYFPEFKEAKDVTIKNLLNHSSGIKELLTLPDILTSSTLFTTKIWDINSIVKTISAKKLVFQTGSNFQYSNTNYVLLGLIAEKIEQKKISQLYYDYILNPLSLDKISLVPQEETPENLISGYDRKLLPTPGMYEVTPQNTAWASAAFTSGALVGNSEQTGLFFHKLLTGQILSSSSLNKMEEFGKKKNPDNEHQEYFGLGLFKFEINSNTYYGHEGLFVGADNVACFRIKDKVTIVILSNVSTFNKFNLLKDIDDML